MIEKIIKEKRKIDYEKVAQLSHKDIVALVNESEKYLDGQMQQMIDMICKHNDEIDVLLVCGPSCSGKTTFAEMVAEELENKGIDSIIVSLDNFFMDRDKTPLLDDGVTKDYESPNSLNLEQMSECFNTLKKTGKCMFPIYDFINGKNLPNSLLINWNHPTKIIVEGIHALNPVIIRSIGFEQVYKIYICANADFVDENGATAISDLQLRYMRRITRDRVSRGYAPLSTYTTWPHVLNGENLYVVPYKDDADVIIDTVHAYEPCLYRFYTAAVLGSMKYSGESLYLQHTLSKTKAFGKKIIPENSLMWEFIKV